MKQLLYEGCTLSGAIVNWTSSDGRAFSYKARPPIRVWFRQKLVKPIAYDIVSRYEISQFERYNSDTGKPIISWIPGEWRWYRIVKPRFGAMGREKTLTHDIGGFEPGELIAVSHKGDPIYVHNWISNDRTDPYFYEGGSFTSEDFEYGFSRGGGVEMTPLDRLYSDFYEALTGWNYDSTEEDTIQSTFQLLIESKIDDSWWKLHEVNFNKAPYEVHVKCGQCKSNDCQEIYSNDLTKFVCGCPASDKDGGFAIEEPK